MIKPSFKRKKSITFKSKNFKKQKKSNENFWKEKNLIFCCLKILWVKKNLYKNYSEGMKKIFS